MSVKKYIHIVIAIIGCIFLFTGCMRHIPIEIKCENVPADSYMVLLVRPVAERKQQLHIPEYIKGTEIEGYNHDGWIPYVYTDLVYTQYTESGKILEIYYGNSEDYGVLRAFCEQYQEIRFAVVDREKGKILFVTSILDLTPSNYFGYPLETTYDMKTDSFLVTEYFEKTIGGKTPFEWLVWITIFSWITNSFFIYILNKSLKTEDIGYLRHNRSLLILLAIPGTVAVLMALVLSIVPYFGGVVELNEIPQIIAMIALFNILYVLGVISLIIALNRNKKLRKAMGE